MPALLPRWARRTAFVAVPVVLAAVAAYAVRSGRDGVDRPAAAVSVGPSATATAAPVPESQLPRLAGVRGAAPAELRLLVSGSRPGVYDPATGRLRTLPGVVIPKQGDVAMIRSGRTDAAVVTSFAGGSTLYVRTAGAAAFRATRGSGEVLPGPQDGLYLLFTTSSRQQVIEARDAAFQRVWRRSLRPGESAWGSTAEGLLVMQDPGETTRRVLRLVVPRTGLVLRSFGSVANGSEVVIAAHQVGYVPTPCPGRCRLRVVELRTGHARSYPLPENRPFGSGTFSSDGQQLAVSWYGEHPQAIGPHAQRGFVAYVDFASGRWRRVPGLDTPAKQTADLAWTPDGHLVLGVRFPDRLHLAVWRPGDQQVRILPTDLITGDNWASMTLMS